MLLRLRGRRLRRALPRHRRRLLGVLSLAAPLLLRLLGRAIAALLLGGLVAAGVVRVHGLLLRGIALLLRGRRGGAVALDLRGRGWGEWKAGRRGTVRGGVWEEARTGGIHHQFPTLSWIKGPPLKTVPVTAHC